jgi:hypothetical protein
VSASAVNQYTVSVTWLENSADVTGFRVDNGCPLGACHGRDAELFRTIGPVTSTTFTVTPGSWTCFRVQAFNSVGASGWAEWGCTQTPGLLLQGNQAWTDTGVTLSRGDRLGIFANGTVHLASGRPVRPAGEQSCTPAANFTSDSTAFPAPRLACWSLIARIGSGPPFEVGTPGHFFAAATGRLYLGINGGSLADVTGAWAVNIEKGGGLPPEP